jgi:hypothetical protein
VILTIGAITGTSRYGASSSNRHYQVACRGMGWATGFAYQRAGTSGTWTSMPTITQALYNSHTYGAYFSSANGSAILAHPNLTGQYQMMFSPVDATWPVSSPVVLAKDVSVRRLAGAVEVKVPFTGSHTVEILNMQGRVVATRSGSNESTYLISLDRQATTMYLVRVTAQGQSFVKKLML